MSKLSHYTITPEMLDSFEAWLEVFLFSKIKNNEVIQPAFTKVDIVRALKETFLTEVRLDYLNPLSPEAMDLLYRKKPSETKVSTDKQWILKMFQKHGVGKHLYTAPHEEQTINGHTIQDIIRSISDFICDYYDARTIAAEEVIKAAEDLTELPLEILESNEPEIIHILKLIAQALNDHYYNDGAFFDTIKEIDDALSDLETPKRSTSAEKPDKKRNDTIGKGQAEGSENATKG